MHHDLVLFLDNVLRSLSEIHLLTVASRIVIWSSLSTVRLTKVWRLHLYIIDKERSDISKWSKKFQKFLSYVLEFHYRKIVWSMFSLICHCASCSTCALANWGSLKLSAGKLKNPITVFFLQLLLKILQNTNLVFSLQTLLHLI